MRYGSLTWISTRGLGGAERVVAGLVARGTARGLDGVVLNPATEGPASFAFSWETAPDLRERMGAADMVGAARSR